MDFSTILGYFSGLHWIKPDLDTSVLLRTTLLIHALDAVLCRIIAGHSGRNKILWTAAGFFLGIWALGTLFFLPAKKGSRS